MAGQLSITVRVDIAKARRRLALIARLPAVLCRVIPLDVALRWVMRGVKVEV